MVTASAAAAISAIERTCSIPSLLGSLFIITTFCSSKLFHKPISRMLFYASFGNMMSNVATLMSKSFIDQPNSAGCQTQAFLIETFMFADVFWALAMATNVYLTFYYRFDGARLRKLEPLHIGLCYGIPFIIGITFIFVKNKDGVRAYGNANLWCWLTVEWDAWQLATYGLIWLIIFIAFAIYVRTGITIYKWRKRLNSFSNSYELNTASQAAQNTDLPGIAKTTKITITTSDSAPPGFGQAFGTPIRPEPVHSANIYTSPAPPVADSSEQRNIRTQHMDRSGRSPSDEAAMSYAKCALLFFTAMLITWIPASANRLYVLIDGKASVQLGYLSAFVLPLQGFWNALIYYYTSRAACKQAIASLRTGRRRLEESDPNGSSFADGINTTDGNSKQGIQLDQMKAAKRFPLIDSFEATAKMADSCLSRDIKLLTYGTLYHRMICSWGGWDLFQELLSVLRTIASKHSVKISNMATRWVLDFPYVGAVIIGARIGMSEHIGDNATTLGWSLDNDDHEVIKGVLSESQRVEIFEAMGDCSVYKRFSTMIALPENIPGFLSLSNEALLAIFGLWRNAEQKQQSDIISSLRLTCRRFCLLCSNYAIRRCATLDFSRPESARLFCQVIDNPRIAEGVCEVNMQLHFYNPWIAASLDNFLSAMLSEWKQRAHTLDESIGITSGGQIIFEYLIQRFINDIQVHNDESTEPSEVCNMTKCPENDCSNDILQRAYNLYKERYKSQMLSHGNGAFAFEIAEIMTRLPNLRHVTLHDGVLGNNYDLGCKFDPVDEQDTSAQTDILIRVLSQPMLWEEARWI
ncbi:hypothetical protein F53441_1556 [Fusarium austroafricanum]|uniref:G-protein coupled receptors family 2 profile 2 domain-containing protein n=1 Tax=Fusarium austroafricanum TaxID=2364996 RepID=A0A8H4KS19_9HYPO|nr:hypothetical protein F53441_1556 [Fusarium austroafricanum]